VDIREGTDLAEATASVAASTSGIQKTRMEQALLPGSQETLVTAVDRLGFHLRFRSGAEEVSRGSSQRPDVKPSGSGLTAETSAPTLPGSALPTKACGIC
jgi:hypothetical protein